MNVAPILARELRSDRHQRRLRKERVLVAAIAALAVVVLASADRWAGNVNVLGLMRLIPIASVAPFVLLATGLSLGSRLLATERREGTLPLLLLTHLSGFDIVLSKLLAAATLQVDAFLAAVPALTLPLILLGFTLEELGLTVLACANLMFAGLALGLVAAVFLDEDKAVAGCLFLALLVVVTATPVARIMPGGSVREWLVALQWLNPAAALAHVSAVAGGLRKSAYWIPLLGSHLVGWGLLAMGGLCLPAACRWRAGFDAGPPEPQWRRAAMSGASSFASRARMLDWNPFLWLASRHQWATIQIWLYLLLSPLLWGWAIWLTWARRGLNVAVAFVVAMAATWTVTFITAVPAEASRRLVEDRVSGALEMALCTPQSVRKMVRGQWLGLGRRYLPPLIVFTILSLALMLSGYATFGFGGMLDPEDRGFWVFAWMAGLVLLPLTLTTLCWVAMRRSLFARNVGQAGALALVQVIGVPWFALACSSMLLHSLLGWDLEWWAQAAWMVGAYVVWLAALAYRARSLLLRDLRQAAAQPSLASSSSGRSSVTMRYS